MRVAPRMARAVAGPRGARRDTVDVLNKRGVARGPSRVDRRARARESTVTAAASLSSFVVDEDDDERGTVERGMDSERLDALLDKAATAPVSVQDIEEFYPYRLDEFQVAATELLVHGSSVVVSAPTGSGKTLVGETAILTALARGEKAIYTTPLKALSNQKLREFQKIFGKRRCGLKTGDVDINGDADVMIMTTEILRNMLYSSAAGGERRREVGRREHHRSR